MRKLLAAVTAICLSAPVQSAQVKWEPLSPHQVARPVPPQTSAATPDTAAAVPLPAASASQQAGKIIMYRGSSIMGAGVACPIRYKGQEIVELARGKYAEWTVPPGRYILTNHTSSVEVAVDPGEVRYVRCMLKTGMLVARADLQIVDEESFNEHRNEYEQKPVAMVVFAERKR